MTWCEVSTLSAPRLIRFSGVVKGPEVKPSTTLGITFFLYEDEQGGAPVRGLADLHCDTLVRLN